VIKAQYNHPEDEFDAVEPGTVPRGVHRAPISRWRRAWPFLVVIILFPVLAFGAVNYWSDVRDAAPTASASPSVAATKAATPAATPSATPTPAGAPELGTPVVVFNATTKSGLAASAAKKLTDAGWTAAKPQDYTGGALNASTVRYSSSDLEATARAAGAALGITNVAKTDGVDGVEIVLEDDYTP
jgi:hypothetical protein